MNDAPYPKRPERLILSSDVEKMMEKKDCGGDCRPGHDYCKRLPSGCMVTEMRKNNPVPVFVDQATPASEATGSPVAVPFFDSPPSGSLTIVPDRTLSCQDGTGEIDTTLIPTHRWEAARTHLLMCFEQDHIHDAMELLGMPVHVEESQLRTVSVAREKVEHARKLAAIQGIGAAANAYDAGFVAALRVLGLLGEAMP